MSLRIKQSLSKTRLFIKRNAQILCAVTLAVTVIAVYLFLSFTVKTVSINCNGNRVCKMYTLKSNISLILSKAGYNDGYSVSSYNTDGKKINIDVCESFPIYVIYNGYTVRLDISDSSCTVLDALLKTGLDIDNNDIISLPLDTVLTEETYIDIVSIDGGDELTASSDDITDGATSVSVSTISETYTDSATGTAIPVSQADSDNQISTLTPSSPIYLDENGNPVNYKSHITVQATAYTYTGHNCSTGVAPQPGYIAVNPNVIPYGTKMYIRSSDGKYTYGYAVAADTGGFIKSRPTNVDLFFSTNAQCTAFGRRNVEIYILE